MREHSRNERAAGPGDETQENAGAEHERRHAGNRPAPAQMDDGEHRRRDQDGDESAMALLDRQLHVTAKAGFLADPG